MKTQIGMALVAPALFIAHPALAREQPIAPQVLFEDLYADVELQRVFPDSKEFADATPRSPPPAAPQSIAISGINPWRLFDYRWTLKQRIGGVSAATLYPLFTQVASEAQAASVAQAAATELLKTGGIVATTLETGQQWDAPNGWAPLQWIAVAGLTGYGRNPLAEQIACRWMVNVSRSIARPASCSKNTTWSQPIGREAAANTRRRTALVGPTA